MDGKPLLASCNNDYLRPSQPSCGDEAFMKGAVALVVWGAAASLWFVG